MGTLITRYGQIVTTADINLDLTLPAFTLEIAPTPILTTRESLGLPTISGGPITLPGAGSLIPASGGGQPPIIVAPPVPILIDLPPFLVGIDGTAQQGQTLTAITNVESASYQWQELIGGAWVNLQGATASTYLVQQQDVGRQIRVESATSDNLTATSNATSAVLDLSGNQYVYEAATGTSIESGLFQYVYGTAVGAMIEAGGEQNIYAGGTAVATMLKTGGIQVDWGNTDGTAINGGTQFVWGTATTTFLHTGQQIVMSGGNATDTEVDPNGEQIVLTGGSASSAWVGGTQSVYGTADNTTITALGTQLVHGLVTNTKVTPNGHQNIYANGTAFGSTLSDGSVQVDWGTATNTTVGTNGIQYVWGVANNTTLSPTWPFLAGGTQYVGAGGFSYGTYVGVNSTQFVYGGGMSVGSTVYLQSNQFVYGNDINTTVQGQQDVWGVTTRTNVIGGTQNVQAGGLARDTTITAYGTVHVFAGGTAKDVTFSGGFFGTKLELILDEGAALTGSISGWQASSDIDLRGIAFNRTTTTLAYASNSNDSGGTLTVADSTHAFSLSLLGQFSAASFAITSDGHGGTSIYSSLAPPPEITITPPAA